VQEKTVRPVGEAREERVDVRILSATHKNLAELVSQGLFREDLYYRINVIEIRVPALRERVSDIPEIADSILGRLARRMGTEAPQLAEDAVSLLQSYNFPGNVRELENVLERAITLCTGTVIASEHIKLRAAARTGATGSGGGNGLETPESAAPASAPVPLGVGGETALGDQLEGIERDAIMKALEKTRYNKTAAAKLLGMSFRALRYRIKKLGIE
jgi:two-component system response regulator PilR (NtrC family)